MKHIFIDINILMDIFAERHPFFQNSFKIYVLGAKGKIKLYTTSNIITTLHYLLKKTLTEDKIRMCLKEINDNIFIIPIDNSVIAASLKSSHKDFEDAIQITAAQSINAMNCIVTRDLKDYKNAEIDVFTPDQFLQQI